VESPHRPQFQWQLEGADVSGAIPRVRLETFNPAVTGNYRVIVSNPVNSQTSSVALVTTFSVAILFEQRGPRSASATVPRH